MSLNVLLDVFFASAGVYTSVAKRDSAACLIIVGIGVLVFGYLEPSLIGGGRRPYAYISVMAVGAMMVIGGALLWTDRASK